MTQAAPIDKTTETEPPAAPAPTPTPASGTSTFHEGFTAALAFVISAIAIWMLYKTFMAGSAIFKGPEATQLKEAYDRQKDVMQYGLALLGTVTGYYLGRVPAERRAEAAQQSSDKAQKTAENAQKAVIHAREDAATSAERATHMKKQTMQAIREAKATLELQVAPQRTASSALESTAPAPSVSAAIHTLERCLRSME
jgi:hypothetical protein